MFPGRGPPRTEHHHRTARSWCAASPPPSAALKRGGEGSRGPLASHIVPSRGARLSWWFTFSQRLTCISGWSTWKQIRARLAFLHDFLSVMKIRQGKVYFFFCHISKIAQSEKHAQRTWYLQITLFGGDRNFLRWEVIDVQVYLPAVLPRLDLWHSACSLPLTLLVQRRRALTPERRQKGWLCVTRPGERRQSPLGPLYPVQIAGIQERRESKILSKDSTRLRPVGERIPAHISAENGTGWYFVLFPHSLEYKVPVKGKCCDWKSPMSEPRLMTWALNSDHHGFYPPQKGSKRKRLLWHLCRSTHTHIYNQRIHSNTCCDLWDESDLVCNELRGRYSSVAPGPGEENANYSLFISLECPWQVAGEWLCTQTVWFSGGLCSLVTYWRSLSTEITAWCYVRERHVPAEPDGTPRGRFQFLNTRFQEKQRQQKACLHAGKRDREREAVEAFEWWWGILHPLRPHWGLGGINTMRWASGEYI